jgi:uncharacterized membrane protein
MSFDTVTSNWIWLAALVIGAGAAGPVGLVVAGKRGARLATAVGVIGGALCAASFARGGPPQGDLPFVLAAILAATGCGLMAGFFFGFSAVVMTSLARQPQSSGMATMQTINVAVFNPWFGTAFVATPAACAFAMILSLFRWTHAAAGHLLLGGALYLLGTLWVTVLFNIPRNDALAALPATAPEAPERWSDYLRTWTAWNHVRTAGALAATVVLMLGLVES